MTEFKQDDIVIFKKPVTSHDGQKVAGAGTMGKVTVVGIGLHNGDTNGIEVLCEGEGYFHCRPQDLDILGEKEDRPAEMKKFRTDDPLTQARTMVHQLFYVGKAPLNDVYVVWFASVLNGWKALVSTNVLDNCYYEVTHDGAKGRTYVDRYVKEFNATVHESGVVGYMKQITHIDR